MPPFGGIQAILSVTPGTMIYFLGDNKSATPSLTNWAARDVPAFPLDH